MAIIIHYIMSLTDVSGVKLGIKALLDFVNV